MLMVEKSKIITSTLLLTFCCSLPAHANDSSYDGVSALFGTQSYQSFPARERSDSISSDPNNAPVELLAERVEYDQKSEIVTAVGNIELVQNGRVLNASQISYDLNRDVVIASGNVRLMETTGEEYFADNFELTDQMKNGFVRELRGMLANGGHFTAEEAEKVNDLKVLMRKATYTACEPCKSNPNKSPTWQLKARDIEHNKESKRISYKDATFEVKGVPVAYLPYFSHPDGSVKRKSGFLTPSIGFDSQLGASYQQEYYWDIEPHRDATIGVAAFTGEAPLVNGEYRHRFENAEIVLDGGLTYSGRTDRNGTTEVAEENETRGHIFADATWNLNDKWRTGVEVEAVTDKQYLRQYNVSNEDVLENRLYVERFSGRDYALAQAIKFKDVRVSSASADQPNVLPEFYAKFIGAPNETLGGRWHLEASGLGLRREGKDRDVLRGTADVGWSRLFSSQSGIITTVETSVRGDAYRTDDIVGSNGQRTNEGALRGSAYAHVKSGLPLAKRLKASQVVVEPIVAITSVTNVDDDDIPNEDSQDVFLDSTNLFNPNRFPGYDRIEDRTHTTYGVRMGVQTDKGNGGEIFLGQSYRFDDDSSENPFQNGSGLDDQKSDFVGAIKANIGSNFNLNYRLQLENDTLASQRHELDTSVRMGPVELSGRYFYADSLDGTNLNVRREQIRSIAKYNFSDNWTVFAGMQYDLAEETQGLRQAVYGFDYDGQCVSYSLSAQRNLTSDSSGDSGTQILMRIGLKTLGEFETSAFTIGGSDGNDDDDDDDDDDDLQDAVQ